jgi:hypothetical protein
VRYSSLPKDGRCGEERSYEITKNLTRRKESIENKPEEESYNKERKVGIIKRARKNTG